MHAVPRAEHGGRQVLRARLARRAGDADDHCRLEPGARPGADGREPAEHVGDPDHCRTRGRDHVDGAVDERDARPAGEGVGHEVVTVARSTQRDEARAGRQRPGVDRERRGDRVGVAGDDRAAGHARELARAQLHPSAPSSSRATAVVERQRAPAESLARLVTLARDHHDVAGHGGAERDPDGGAAVELDGDLAVAAHERGEHRVGDGLRILVARVVGGQHHDVGAAGRGRAHERPLGGVALAAAAEHEDHPASITGEVMGRTQHRVELLRGVRVVDENREGLAFLDRLGAAADPRRAHAVGDGVETEPDRACGRGRGEDVPHVEAPDERRVDADAGARSVLDDGERNTARADDHVVGHDVGVAGIGRVRPHVEPGRARVLTDADAVGIVEVGRDRTNTIGLEQAALRGEVRLHRTVVVEVLVAQIGEAHGREPGGVDAAEVERARRDLHGDGLHPAVAHPREQQLELIGLRHVGAAPLLDLERDPVDEHAVVADEARVLPRGLRDRREQGRGRALPGGAGDPEAPHRARRVPVERGRGAPEHARHAGDAGLRDREREEALDEQRDGAGGSCVVRVVVAVDGETGAAREAGTGRDPATVLGDRRDLDVGVVGALQDVEAREQVVPPHACASSRLGQRTRLRVSSRSSLARGGDHGIGGTRSAPRACCMICANTGAATVPPK